jgi:hypothetical protein
MRNDTYYGFSTKAINKKFEGGLTYCNTFCINREYAPVAVYKVAEPNREKGHKDFLLLQIDLLGQAYIRGMDSDDMEKHRYQEGIKCLKCGNILYSINRHHYHECSCLGCSIDGGRDYLKIGGSNYAIVKYDLIEDKIL